MGTTDNKDSYQEAYGNFDKDICIINSQDTKQHLLLYET